MCRSNSREIDAFRPIIELARLRPDVQAGGLLGTMAPLNPGRYPRQRIMILRIDDYAFLVPFVENDDHIFLKTIIPSRKATRDFIDKARPHEA